MVKMNKTLKILPVISILLISMYGVMAVDAGTFSCS